jgi:hypothetical protein
MTRDGSGSSPSTNSAGRTDGPAVGEDVEPDAVLVALGAGFAILVSVGRAVNQTAPKATMTVTAMAVTAGAPSRTSQPCLARDRAERPSTRSRQVG